MTVFNSKVGRRSVIKGGAAAGAALATPTFLINGENVGPHSWATLEPLLQEAGAR